MPDLGDITYVVPPALFEVWKLVLQAVFGELEADAQYLESVSDVIGLGAR